MPRRPAVKVIVKNLYGARWFGGIAVGGICAGCSRNEMIRTAYDISRSLGWGACSYCISKFESNPLN